MERAEIAGGLTAAMAGLGWVYSWELSEDIPQTFVMQTSDKDTVYVTLNWPEDFEVAELPDVDEVEAAGDDPTPVGMQFLADTVEAVE